MHAEEGIEFAGMLEDFEGLDEHELRDLIERTHQIVMLTEHPGWVFYKDHLVSQLLDAQKLILSGGCKNIEQYRVKTGYVQGLQAAMQAPDKLQQQVERMQARYEEDF